MGMEDGSTVGSHVEGFNVGCEDGYDVGPDEGHSLGKLVGCTLGVAVEGKDVGPAVVGRVVGY